MMIKWEASASANGDRERGPLWAYRDRIAQVRCVGWFDAMDFGVYRDAYVVCQGRMPGRPGEIADGPMYELTYTDGDTQLWWFNVTDLFLMTDTGDTIERLACGGGLITGTGPGPVTACGGHQGGHMWLTGKPTCECGQQQRPGTVSATL